MERLRERERDTFGINNQDVRERRADRFLGERGIDSVCMCE